MPNKLRIFRFILLAFSFLTISFLTLFLYERLFVQKTLGSDSILASAIMGAAAVFFLVSYVLAKGRHVELVKRTCLVLTSASVAYLLLDISAGFFLIDRLSPQNEPDPLRHHRLIPGSLSEFNGPEFSYIQRTNSLGLRGEEFDALKGNSTYRILMLGDSFTMGKGVPDDKTFSKLVENTLNDFSSSCSGPTIEILNGGVDSYTPLLAYIYYANELKLLNADLVVFNLDMSDLVQEAGYRAEAVLGDEGTVIAVPGKRNGEPFNQRLRRWIDEHLYLTRLGLYHLDKVMGVSTLNVGNVVERASPELLAHTLADDVVDRSHQWSAIFDSISRLRDLATEQLADFVLTTYPWGHQVSAEEWKQGRSNFMEKESLTSDRSRYTVITRSQELNIKLFDAFPAFRAYDGAPRLYFEYDMHWTSTGHEVMAQAMSKFLKLHFADSWCMK